MRLLRLSTSLLAVALALTACSVRDSATARRAEKSLVGLSEVDLEGCVGVPNRHDLFGRTTVLSYDGSSTSTGGMSITLPIVGGISFTGGGYCHMNVRLDNGRVTAVHYTGETDAFLSPEAYCAPLVRACLQSLHPAAPAPSSPTALPATGIAAPVSPGDSKGTSGAGHSQ
jgi:hypothetical protein